jgi:hypothetical protein
MKGGIGVPYLDIMYKLPCKKMIFVPMVVGWVSRLVSAA